MPPFARFYTRRIEKSWNGIRIAVSTRLEMKTPPTRSPAQPHADWLRDCGFQSRHDPVIHGVAPGILSQNIEKPAKKALSSFPPITETQPSTLPGRQIFPLAEIDPPKSRSSVKQSPGVAKDVSSELRTFRQLSAGV